MAIYCKECEQELSKSEMYEQAILHELVCGHCGPNAQLMSQEEFDKLQAGRDTAKTERKRLRRNADQRARYAAMRSLGMTRTPYGWE